jgi:hypothetical protein
LEILKINKVDDEILETLAEFLRDSIKLQYKNIFEETLISTSSKSSAKKSANIEQNAETRFQLLKYILKQLEKLKLEDEDNKSALAAITSSLCKSECAVLMAEMIQLQAFHNEVTFEESKVVMFKKF